MLSWLHSPNEDWRGEIPLFLCPYFGFVFFFVGGDGFVTFTPCSPVAVI